MFDKYDVFLSYRWGNNDSMFVQCVFDRLTLHTVGYTHRSIVTFLDNRRLQMGRQLQGDLAKAISNTSIMMPIISSEALKKMLDHSPSTVDNVLLEWLLALNCYRHISCRLNKILPVLFGSRKEGAVMSIFEENIVDRLPDLTPDATLELAWSLLNERGISIKEDLMCLTVRDIAKRMLQFLCILGWKKTDNALLVAHVSDSVVEGLEELQIDQQAEEQASVVPLSTEVDNVISSTEQRETGNICAPVDGDSVASLVSLDSLTVEQVGHLMHNIDLAMYVDELKTNRVDGEVLALCETVDDLKEGMFCVVTFIV